MSALKNKYRLVAVLIALAGGVLPIVGYWLLVGRVQNISPDEAKAMLADPAQDALLVDVRPAEDYLHGHIDAAQNWPFDKILSIESEKYIPSQFVGKRLLLICQSGISSAIAARKLQQYQLLDVKNVQGGMQAWVANGEKPCTLSLCRIKLASGEAEELPFRESSILDQWIAVITGFAVKPIYTMISLGIILVLWRRKSPDLAALRWAMICFFVGENFCAINYLLCHNGSLLFEYLHSYGMVLCFGLTAYALLEGLDIRIIKLSDPQLHCVALGLCGKCIKHAEVPCGLKRMFLLLIPAVLLLCPFPLTADFVTTSYNTKIFGTFYNYSHPVSYQIFEIRYLPVVAFVLFFISWVILISNKKNAIEWSKLIFAAGVGALGFCFFRLILVQIFHDHLSWFEAWEEITEFLFIISLSVILWLFRQGLFRKE
jgi:rhodanese-related sulfurtransferase